MAYISLANRCIVHIIPIFHSILRRNHSHLATVYDFDLRLRHLI